MGILSNGGTVYSYVHLLKTESLLAAVAINVALAVVLLSLFSIFKNQPSNATIYYARSLSLKHHIPFHDCSATVFHRFLPSVGWIPRALRVTDDQILEENGLDALALVRLFKFGSEILILHIVIDCILVMVLTFFFPF